MVDAALSGCRPSIVWFKAQAPGYRSDGSSLVTFSLARELARHFELHLVCLSTRSTVGPPEAHCVPPFSSVTVIKPSHQGGGLRRFGVGGWYWALDALRVRPLASSVEASGRISKLLSAHVERVGAIRLVTEHWTTGRNLERCGVETTLLVVDVEHQNIRDEHRDGTPRERSTAKRRAQMVEREELRACRSAGAVNFLSAADRDCFEQIGYSGGSVVRVPTSPVAVPRKGTARGTRLVMLGGLGWWPNVKGAQWFFERVWPEVTRLCPDAAISVIGTAATHLTKRWESYNVTFYGFVADLSSALADSDIGIVPVHFGTGVKTKTIDLLAAGLPIVSTRNGVRGTSAEIAGALISDDSTGFAASIHYLVENALARSELATAGRERFMALHGVPLDPSLFVPDRLESQ